MKLLPFLILTALGLVAGFLLAPFEQEAVRNHLLGFPNANPVLQNFRPLAVFGLFLVPALGALYYALASILDRYLFRRALGAFLLISSSFILLFVLLDLQDSLSDLSAGAQHFEEPFIFLGTYYTVLLSQITVLLLPFTILLALLYSLGQLSSSREIIAFTQTGRGIVKLLGPLLVLGGLLSLSSFFLSFHLAPWSEGYREALLDSAKRKADIAEKKQEIADASQGAADSTSSKIAPRAAPKDDSASQASNVLFRNAENNRVWFIGRFPYDFAAESPLLDVRISTRNPDGSLHDILSVPEARWSRETGVWQFTRPKRLLAQTTPTPLYEDDLPEVMTVAGWSETPSQLIQDGLDARFLGIPDLTDWLRQNSEKPGTTIAPFKTQLQYRWAQPILCLVAVLLAAPLGISFSRRGKGGTVALAVILSGFMLFSAEVFLAFGDAGRLPPAVAAWATNGFFALIALLLIRRRLTGRPIFQTLRKSIGG